MGLYKHMYVTLVFKGSSLLGSLNSINISSNLLLILTLKGDTVNCGALDSIDLSALEAAKYALVEIFKEESILNGRLE
jgi:hypothetical protein